VASRRRASTEKGKVYIPKDEKLQIEIIQLHHDIPVTEHGGI